MNALAARSFAPAVLLLAACAAPAVSTHDENADGSATPTQGAAMSDGTTGGEVDVTTGSVGATTSTGGGDATPTGECGKENETIETFPGHPNFKKCCPGLGAVISMGRVGADGKCLPQPPVASTPAVCTKTCGDGKCDGDENKCNCADCK